jgi:hypothetical protein
MLSWLAIHSDWGNILNCTYLSDRKILSGTLISPPHSRCTWGPDHMPSIWFFSKYLEPAQQKYSAFDRYLFVVNSDIHHFRHMPKGGRFTVYTEH